nr:MAG TPA: hypothetical protein [Caudoviricetes sp.]
MPFPQVNLILLLFSLIKSSPKFRLASVLPSYLTHYAPFTNMFNFSTGSTLIISPYLLYWIFRF